MSFTYPIYRIFLGIMLFSSFFENKTYVKRL
nr:MAG TPA: hypothetical protein [Caudoviricetes sp.]